MVKISKLQLIKSPEQFFNTDKVLLADVIHINDFDESPIKRHLRNHKATFTYNGELYYPLILMGSPENLYLNAKKGFPLKCGNSIEAVILWDGDLKRDIEQRKIYDFSAYYQLAKTIKGFIQNEPEFMVKRYVLPYISEAVSKAV